MFAFLGALLVVLFVVSAIAFIFLIAMAAKVKDFFSGLFGTAKRAARPRQTVRDTRTREQAQRKVIPKDEGEYVDFEEI